MMTPKSTLEAHLQRLANDAQEIQRGMAAKQDQIRQMHERIAQLSAEVEQGRGALTYNRMLAEVTEKQLKELAAPQASSPSP